MPRITFVTTILKSKTKNVTGIVVPPRVVAALSESRRPAVKVTLKGYTYRSTVATMDGRFMIGLSAENRAAAGVEGGERLEVFLELDAEPRVVKTPMDLKAALVRAKVLDVFDKTAPSRRKEFVRQVEDAKTPETRERRILKVVQSLKHAG